MEFKCPHCNNERKVDCLTVEENLGQFTSRRILSTDEMNGDGKDYNTVELWQCWCCYEYFKVYYKISRITKMVEEYDSSGKD